MELIQIRIVAVEIMQSLNKNKVILPNLGIKKAETERDFAKGYAFEIYKLKSEGIPATLIKEIAKGNCADLIYERDVAESNFISKKIEISVEEKEISLLQTLSKRMEEM